MNKIFNVKWNDVKSCFVVVHEKSRSQGKKASVNKRVSPLLTVLGVTLSLNACATDIRIIWSQIKQSFVVASEYARGGVRSVESGGTKLAKLTSSMSVYFYSGLIVLVGASSQTALAQTEITSSVKVYESVASAEDKSGSPAAGPNGASGSGGYYVCTDDAQWGAACVNIGYGGGFGSYSNVAPTPGGNASIPASGTIYAEVQSGSSLLSVGGVSGTQLVGTYLIEVTQIALGNIRSLPSGVTTGTTVLNPSTDPAFSNPFQVIITPISGIPVTIDVVSYTTTATGSQLADSTNSSARAITITTLQNAIDAEISSNEALDGFSTRLVKTTSSGTDYYTLSVIGPAGEDKDFTLSFLQATYNATNYSTALIPDVSSTAVNLGVISSTLSQNARYKIDDGDPQSSPFNSILVGGYTVALLGVGTGSLLVTTSNGGEGAPGNAGDRGDDITYTAVASRVTISPSESNPIAFDLRTTGGAGGAAQTGATGGMGGAGGNGTAYTVPRIWFIPFPPLPIPDTDAVALPGAPGGNGAKGGAGGDGTIGGQGGDINFDLSAGLIVSPSVAQAISIGGQGGGWRSWGHWWEGRHRWLSNFEYSIRGYIYTMGQCTRWYRWCRRRWW